MLGERGLTKRDASAWASKVKPTKAEGAYASPARGRVTVGDLSVGWLERQEQTDAPSYYRTIAYAYPKHVATKWDTVPVNKVDTLAEEPGRYADLVLILAFTGLVE
ncbi:hypothetical protein [Mycolicibacterium sp.]|uniref:hypothetical protein n=1 Tax=Mycolicibacterium sp. TaxID=2320850 RepID=UPI001A263AF8|nr:hypothetical protein [Mycolicibacterium sp.]MBJ7341904.1 hypothetical protein [Mycolicibacterium sp.]